MQHKSGSLPPTTAGGGTAPVARAGQWSGTLGSGSRRFN